MQLIVLDRLPCFQACQQVRIDCQKAYHHEAISHIYVKVLFFQVVNKWSQIPKCRPLIVQKYVAKPHLINNTKYDLRIYVLLTSLSPLRIFLYDDGLVRFASNTYSSDADSLSDVFTHLTNYSINKNSSTYQVGIFC